MRSFLAAMAMLFAAGVLSCGNTASPDGDLGTADATTPSDLFSDARIAPDALPDVVGEDGRVVDAEPTDETRAPSDTVVSPDNSAPDVQQDTVVPPVCGNGFTTTVEWALPSGSYVEDYPYFTTADQSYDQDGEDVLHALLDLTGDGRPDLVWTFDELGDEETGTSHWLVFENTGSGFAAAGKKWALPAVDGASFPFFQVADQSYDQEGEDVLHLVTDLTGDGLPDLVWTYDETGDAAVGTDYWLVYKNTGTGFSSTPIVFALPPANLYDYEYFLAADQSYSQEEEDIMYLLADMDGDGKQDLVWTFMEQVGSEVGESEWLVFRNLGNSFDDSPLHWALPGAGGDGYAYFLAVDQAYSSDGEEIMHDLHDLTGDGKPDLVWTYVEEVDSKVGNTEWLVYKNTGKGFSTSATHWSLPPVTTADFAYFQSADQYYIDDDEDVLHLLSDLTGDGLPDLLWTYQEAPGGKVGDTEWLVHQNTGSGFDTQPISWSLPEAPGAIGYEYYMAADQSYTADEEDVLHLLTDLTGDGRPDLLWTFDENGDQQTGNTHWVLFDSCE